jgi:hypothetical protein
MFKNMFDLPCAEMLPTKMPSSNLMLGRVVVRATLGTTTEALTSTAKNPSKHARATAEGNIVAIPGGMQESKRRGFPRLGDRCGFAALAL